MTLKKRTLKEMFTVSKISGKNDHMGRAEDIDTSFYGHQIILFQFSLKIIDENQRCMLSDLKNPNFFPKPMYFCRILDSAKI